MADVLCPNGDLGMALASGGYRRHEHDDACTVQYARAARLDYLDESTDIRQMPW
jgi:hypothetical protein